jgi:hypothetical protein
MQKMRLRYLISTEFDDFKSHWYVRSDMLNVLISGVIQNSFSVQKTASSGNRKKRFS